MKTFKEYLTSKKEKKLPSMETSFGSHSIEKKEKKLPAMETSFGSHSIEKKLPLKEGVSDHEIGAAAANNIHQKIAPLSSELSIDESKSVKKYSEDSLDVNSTLHNIYNGKQSHEISDYARHVADAKVLGGVLSRHKTTDNMHVFTGIRCSPASYFHSEHEEHARVHLPAFTSTSTSIGQSKEFSAKRSHVNDSAHGITYPSGGTGVKHILHISVPSGTHAMSLKAHSMLPEEDEVLLHRGHDLEIHRTPEKLDDIHYLWHAKIVEHKPETI